jgi:hypothetical protein
MDGPPETELLPFDTVERHWQTDADWSCQGPISTDSGCRLPPTRNGRITSLLEGAATDQVAIEFEVIVDEDELLRRGRASE